MANDYYEVTTDLTPFTKARSQPVDNEFAGVEEAFEKLPSLAQTRSANPSYVAAGGTANAITLNHPLVTWTSYTGKGGHKINIRITTTNTDAVTLAVNGLATKACKRNDGTALQSGDLVAGGFYDFIYDETAGYFVVPEAINGVLEDCEEQVVIAVSATNFKGLWSAQAGAASIPYSVYHNGGFYALVTNLADVTAKTPGVDPEWVLIDAGLSYAGMTGAVTAPAVAIHAGDFWRLITSSSDITADVPGVSAKWEKVDKTVYKPVGDYQQFTSSGTWTKPSGNYTLVYIEAIGGGGSGGKASVANSGYGGGGGEFVAVMLPIASLGATETVTIGAGGAAQTGATTGGNNGGNTTVGSLVTARGGKGGSYQSTSLHETFSNAGDGTIVGGGYSCGAGSANNTGNVSEAGNSTMGGAGGGSTLRTSGGVSQRGGNGGAGASTGDGGNGVQPGGGGGGTGNGTTSGAGGNGRVRVWCF
jgi:hypothetical protein